MELLKCDKWPELLRQTIGNNSTPFREMIKKMPGIFIVILTVCVCVCVCVILSRYYSYTLNRKQL